MTDDANPGPRPHAHLEVWAPTGRVLVHLGAGRITLGRGTDTDVPLPFDPSVSHLHAAVEAVGGGWCVTDLGSRNGTWVCGERIVGLRALRDGDALVLGRTRVVFRVAGGTRTRATESAALPPALTRRERDVLVALCRPMAGEVFSEPASVREIAAALVVGEAAVKQHLGRLYVKFGLAEGEARRRVQLANEAVRRGAVSPAELRAP